MAAAKKNPRALVDSDNDSLSVLYYGDGGTGKTSHLCSLANVGRVLIVNAEKGVKRRALQRLGITVDNIEVFPVGDEEITNESLEREWLRVREALNEDPTAYVGFLWDSMTQIYNILLEHVLTAGATWEERTGKKRDQRQNYGDANDQLRKLTRKAMDLPCHFGASALERRDQDDDGVVTYRPSIPPALMKDCYGWFDLVAHTTLEEVGPNEQYRGLFRPLGKYRGKDREGIMPRTLVSPSFDRVIAYAEESLTAKTDPIMQIAQKQIDEQKKNKES
jgi:AAA domain